MEQEKGKAINHKDTLNGENILLELKKKARNFPINPGVYLMKDADETIVYVGKAKILKNRVRSYFSGDKDVKTRVMLSKVRSLEYIVTNTEYEALLLENNLIKQWKPKYNINLKDGKTYPVIRITNEEFPRVFRTRRIIEDGSQYFGPFPDVRSIDRYLEIIERLFPLRKCRGPLKERKSPCLYYYMGRCAAPCSGKISREDYAEHVEKIKKLLSGETKELITDLEVKMRNAVEELNFEKAAYYRDSIQAVTSLEQQQVVDFDPEVRDYIGFVTRDESYSFVVFQMRGGKLLGRDVFRTESLASDTETLEQFIVQYYSSIQTVPVRLFVPLPIDSEVIGEFFRTSLGSDVQVLLPESGRDRSILNLAAENARQDLDKQYEERGETPGLKELQKALGLAKFPMRIEGFDIAQLNGKFPVASMVSFLNGRPEKAKYRKFHMKTLNGQIDDFESMREVVARRYTRVMNEGLEQPDLILIDGGKGQVNAAVSVLELLGLKISVAGLAKRNEEVFLPGRKDPVILPEGSSALRVLQYVRDESHRFATSFNQKLRQKTVSFSLLESVPGIGKKRSKKLLEEFGSVAGILEKTADEIAGRTGIGLTTAEQLLELLKKGTDEV